MKMRHAAALLLTVLLLLLTALPAAAASDRLLDEADLLTDAEEATLSETLDEISEHYGMEAVVVTAESLGGKTAAQYAEDVYDAHSYGYDGILLLISDEGRYILTSGECYYALDDAWLDACVAAIIGDIEAGFYAEAFDTFAQICDQAFAAIDEIGGYSDEYDYESGGDFDWFKCGLISLVVGFVIALIVVSVMKGQLKSVKFQATAADYVRQGSFVLTSQSDLFLYSRVTRTVKPKPQKTSGGGRSGGGGARGGRSF